MRHDRHPRALCQQRLDRRRQPLDAGRVGDLAVLDRDIQVGAHQHAFAGDIEIVCCAKPRHGAPRSMFFGVTSTAKSRPIAKPRAWHNSSLTMPNALDKFAYEAAQMARIGWFFGQKLLAARLAKPVPVPDKLRGRKTPDRQRLIRDLWQLIERDWQHIAKGIYAPPDDWRGNPLDGLRRAADFFADLRAVEARRHGEVGERLMTEAPPERYPPYYRRKFHFQTDGYLSEASAERYDYQVEVLFGGAAAPMRRQALVPLREALLRHPGGAANARLLDTGCGTGAFLREVKRNY